MNVLGTFTPPKVASLPATGVAGQIVALATTGALYGWQNGAWAALGGEVIGGAATVDFGTGGLVATVDVTDARALITHNVLVSISLNMPSGVAADELEMDFPSVAGVVPVAGTVRLRAFVAGPAKLTGKRALTYQLL